MENLQEENTFQAILLPKYFSDQIGKQYNQIFDIAKQQLESLQTYSDMLQSENTFEMYQGLVGLREMISNKTEDAQELNLQIVNELNSLKYINHIIESNENQLILLEALQIVDNLSIHSILVDYIVKNGSINCIIQKFSTGDYHDLIIEKVCLIFNHVTFSTFDHLTYMFKSDTLKILNNFAKRVKDFKNLKLISQLVQSINDYFGFDSKLLLKDIKVSLSIFSKWIQQDLTTEILQYIFNSFYLFLLNYPYSIDTIIHLEIIPIIIELSEKEDQDLDNMNICILQQILNSHENHQEYLYGLGVFQHLGRKIKKYYQSHEDLDNILSAFKIISLSEYLSSRILNSDELDQILSLINYDNTDIQDKVHDIVENLIKDYDIQSMDLIQNKKIIQLCKIFVSRDLIEIEQQELCKRVQDLCEAYLKDERFNQFNEELLELKHQIIQKLQLLNDQSI